MTKKLTDYTKKKLEEYEPPKREISFIDITDKVIEKLKKDVELAIKNKDPIIIKYVERYKDIVMNIVNKHVDKDDVVVDYTNVLMPTIEIQELIKKRKYEKRFAMVFLVNITNKSVSEYESPLALLRYHLRDFLTKEVTFTDYQLPIL